MKKRYTILKFWRIRIWISYENGLQKKFKIGLNMWSEKLHKQIKTLKKRKRERV